ncbi:hypothetical protein ZHAS_00000047 [Anopheles sinensis]|uniref:Uncharacterized protein n=1 Tax=Anopheles sinensis TaxID=74873 RepID=A0A084V9T5_ANOSI|nr:hypothetical protein ZHAS_00000047 [Anopheles sinensis]
MISLVQLKGALDEYMRQVSRHRIVPAIVFFNVPVTHRKEDNSLAQQPNNPSRGQSGGKHKKKETQPSPTILLSVANYAPGTCR